MNTKMDTKMNTKMNTKINTKMNTSYNDDVRNKCVGLLNKELGEEQKCRIIEKDIYNSVIDFSKKNNIKRKF